MEMDGDALITADRDGDGLVCQVSVTLRREGEEESFRATIAVTDRQRVTTWLMGHRDPNRIRYFRRQKGWTQRQLEDAAALPPQAVTQYETGRRRPTVKVAVALAAALGVSASDLGVKMYGVDD